MCIRDSKGAFAGVAEPTVVVGHTHMPFDRLAAGRRVINAGSVGLQYGHQGASWALLGPDITLRRTRYDAGAAAAMLWSAARDLPGIEGFTGNVRAPAGADEALKAFTLDTRLRSRER